MALSWHMNHQRYDVKLCIIVYQPTSLKAFSCYIFSVVLCFFSFIIYWPLTILSNTRIGIRFSLILTFFLIKPLTRVHLYSNIVIIMVKIATYKSNVQKLLYVYLLSQKKKSVTLITFIFQHNNKIAWQRRYNVYPRKIRRECILLLPPSTYLAIIVIIIIAGFVYWINS